MELEELATEATLLRQTNHPSLLPLHCCFVVHEAMELWMVMPLAAGGSLASLLRSHYPRGMPEALIATTTRSVLSALDYLHRHARATHRDVKAANVLVDDAGQALLADLGAAAVAKGSNDIDVCFSPSSPGSSGGDGSGHGMPLKQQLTEVAGSPCWMAPEVAAGEPYDWHADIWSFGITLIELAQGHPPFYNLPQRELWMQLVHGDAPELEDEPGPGGRRWSRELRDLVGRCLQREPEDRPSAAQLLHDRFFRLAKGPGLIKALLLDEGAA